MDSKTSLPSPKLPKSPRSQSLRQASPAEPQKLQPNKLPAPRTSAPRPLRQVRGPPESRQMVGLGTFLAESPKMEENEDFEDPHDLSLSRNHVLRASMVDNLVLSLDHFPGGAFEEAPYTPRSNSYDTSARFRGRGRGHTFSSSTSSENDIQHLKAAPQHPQTIPRVPVRGSVRYQKDLQKLPSIYGEDEDSTRAKVYEAQRATQPRHPTRKENNSTGGKSDHSSNASSIDLGHLASMNGRLGAPGNRRSRSFDFGSRQREDRVLPAPISIIPSKLEEQLATLGSPLVRKTSTKSSKSAYVKQKSRTPAAGLSATRTDSVPQLPSMKSIPSFQNADMKPSIGSPTEPTAAPRPGFFRRVFGSKNSVIEAHSAPNVLTKSQHGRATPVPDESSHPPMTPPVKMQRPVRRTSIDASANKENQPVLNKKSSAFFRRRKKSVSTNVPPPLPLTLKPERPDEDKPMDGTSPVSSLRAFMGPYLADPPPSATGHGHPRGHVRTNSMQGYFTPDLPPPAFGLSNQGGNRLKPGHSRNGSHGSSKTLKSAAKLPSNLRTPHQDSFLADSSSAEDPVKKSPFDAHSDTELPDPPRSHPNDLNLQQTHSASSLPSPKSDSQPLGERQGSWISDTASPSSSMVAPIQGVVDADQSSKSFSKKRQNTLEIPRKPIKSSPFNSASDVSEVYRSAPSTPLIIETPDGDFAGSARSFNSVARTESLDVVQDYANKARQIYDHTDDVVDAFVAGIWLGEDGTDPGTSPESVHGALRLGQPGYPRLTPQAL